MSYNIPENVMTIKLVTGILGIMIPVVLMVLWKIKTKCQWRPVIVGAIIFILFTQVVEGVPKYIFFLAENNLTAYVWSHTWAYVLIGCLQAGICEEIGRYVAFRWILKSSKRKENAVMYGIGHGGIEAILILGIGSFSTMAMIRDINNGSFAEKMSGLSSAQMQSVELQLGMLAGAGIAGAALAVAERLIAISLHIALSVVVFKSVREKKVSYLILAILLHALFDVPAALGQCGVISGFTIELWLLIIAVCICIYAYSLYKKMVTLNSYKKGMLKKIR